MSLPLAQTPPTPVIPIYQQADVYRGHIVKRLPREVLLGQTVLILNDSIYLGTFDDASHQPVWIAIANPSDTSYFEDVCSNDLYVYDYTTSIWVKLSSSPLTATLAIVNGNQLVYAVNGKVVSRVGLRELTYDRSSLVSIITPPAFLTIALETSFQQVLLSPVSQVTIASGLPVLDTSSPEAIVDVSTLPLPPANPVLTYSYIVGLDKFTVNHTLVWTNIDTSPSGSTGSTALLMNSLANGIKQYSYGSGTQGVITRVSAGAVVEEYGSPFGVWRKYDDGDFTGEVIIKIDGTYDLKLQFVYSTAPRYFSYVVNGTQSSYYSWPVTSDVTVIRSVQLKAGDLLRFSIYDFAATYKLTAANYPASLILNKID